jgi:hypothetical protein
MDAEVILRICCTASSVEESGCITSAFRMWNSCFISSSATKEEESLVRGDICESAWCKKGHDQWL